MTPCGGPGGSRTLVQTNVLSYSFTGLVDYSQSTAIKLVLLHRQLKTNGSRFFLRLKRSVWYTLWYEPNFTMCNFVLYGQLPHHWLGSDCYFTAYERKSVFVSES